MNPFERRLIHTALNDMEGVTTKSEGEGLFKQVRISIDDELPPLRRE
jgi:spoIIIJ-associated protein